MVQNCDLLSDCEKIILGFSDTLPLFKKKITNFTNYKLTTLALSELKITCSNAHDANFDVDVLEQLAQKFLTLDDLTKVYATVNN